MSAIEDPLKGYKDIVSKYILYFLSSPSTDMYINKITHGIDMPSLGKTNGINLLFPLPPFNEQKRIVEKIDKIMNYLNEIEACIY